MEWVRKGKGSRMEEEGWLDGELPILLFPELKRISCIRHGFTTREGGISEGYLSSLNLS